MCKDLLLCCCEHLLQANNTDTEQEALQEISTWPGRASSKALKWPCGLLCVMHARARCFRNRFLKSSILSQNPSYSRFSAGRERQEATVYLNFPLLICRETHLI